MEKKKIISEQQQRELIKFREFIPQLDSVSRTKGGDTSLDKELEKRVNEMFFNRKVLEGLGAYVYEINRITGSIFKYDPQTGFYEMAFEASDILKNDIELPRIERIDEKDAKKKRFHKTDKINVSFLSKLFSFIGEWKKDKCWEIIICDEAKCFCETKNINEEKFNKIIQHLKDKSIEIKNYFYVNAILTTSVESNCLDEFNIKTAVDGGVYVKMDGNFYSSKQDSTKELKISATLKSIDEIVFF